METYWRKCYGAAYLHHTEPDRSDGHSLNSTTDLWRYDHTNNPIPEVMRGTTHWCCVMHRERAMAAYDDAVKANYNPSQNYYGEDD